MEIEQKTIVETTPRDFFYATFCLIDEISNSFRPENRRENATENRHEKAAQRMSRKYSKGIFLRVVVLVFLLSIG
jgi:hypothetical protein